MLRNFLGHFESCAVVHLNAGSYKITINGWKKIEFDVTKRQQTNRHDHHRNGERDRNQDRKALCRETQYGIKRHADEPLQHGIDSPTDQIQKAKHQVGFVIFRHIKA